MSELNPSEAQRKAMAVRLCDSMGLDEEVGLYEVDRQIAAANKASEGAPVGTIARRPDGVFVAVRILTDYLERYWTHTCTDHSLNDDWPDPDDADSWPVIFAPYEVGSSEHSVSDGDAYDPTKPRNPDIWRVAEWLEEHDDGEPYEIYTPDGSYGYRLSASKVGHHPTAQQEPERPASEVWQEIAKRWGGRRPKPARTPRELLTLDCPEARDGTVWGEAYPGVWTFWHNGVWMTNQGEDGGQYPVQESGLLVRFGPYTEVLDVG